MTTSASCSRRFGWTIVVGAGLLACDPASSDTNAGPATFGPTSASATSGGGDETSGAGTDGSGVTTDDDPSTTTDDDPSTTTDDPPISCDAPLTACGVQCVDLLSDVTNCGDCGISCIVPNATASCMAGNCAVQVCEDGFSDCDGNPDNGCEAQSTCQEGADCMTTCGSTGTTTCTATCEAVCNAPVESCNAIDDDCNDQCDEGLMDCRVGVHRSNGGSLGHFYTTDLNEAQTGGFNLEAADYYHLYGAQTTGLQPFFRCLKPNGKRLYTTSTNCEGLGAPELTVGFISPNAACGSIPLYRTFSPSIGNHFYTTSAGERDNAVTNLGYVDEGVAGHVWAQPSG